MAGHTPGPASPAKEYEPIVHLVTALENAGQQLTSSGGDLTALWHARQLDGYLSHLQLEDVRKAVQKANDAIAAYEAAIDLHHAKATGGA